MPPVGSIEEANGSARRYKIVAEWQPSAYADDVRTAVGNDDDGGVVGELARIAEDRRALTRREEVAVRRARHTGLSWAEIGTLLGVTKQTIHRKYRKVG